MTHPTIGILDFGSQYTQVIARRVREANVHSKVFRFSVSREELEANNVVGIILSGGPASVFEANAPKPSFDVFGMNIPVLGICYGLQLMADSLGGQVEPSSHREYGHTSVALQTHSALFENIPPSVNVWNSHGDRISRLPESFVSIATTDNAPFAAIEDPGRHFYGMQFHPEVAHSESGKDMIHNFLYNICGCTGDWKMSRYAEELVDEIRQEVGNKHVVLGLSGGVDSSVAAALINKAIGAQLTCVFVDNGLLRKNEREDVENLFAKNFHMDLKVVDASDRFLSELSGVRDPEQKRKIIGKLFVDIFQETVSGINDVDYLAQGTIYPDVIESVSIDGNPASVIKSHHNVGGLPESLKLNLLEPLRELFKDEVRTLGEELGLPYDLLWRHPFPGPGLGVRVMGEVKKEFCDILREADAIFIQELHKAEVYYDHWQCFCVFLPVRTVGVMGDSRTHGYTIAVRSVDSVDAMTADWSRLSYDLLQRVSSRIINEVEGVSRVVYDISSKPPSTIEWE